METMSYFIHYLVWLNLVQNNSYLFNNGTEYSFKYLGVTSSVLVKDIQLL